MFALDDVRLVWSPSDLRAATQCRYAFLRGLDVLLGRAEPSVATADPTARQLAALGEREGAAGAARDADDDLAAGRAGLGSRVVVGEDGGGICALGGHRAGTPLGQADAVAVAPAVQAEHGDAVGRRRRCGHGRRDRGDAAEQGEQDRHESGDGPSVRSVA